MSTFRNITNGTLYIQGYLRSDAGALGVGAQSYVAPGATFTGSNYFKRFTYAGLIAAGVEARVAAQEAILEITVDDGGVFSNNISAPNTPRVYHSTLTAGQSATLNFTTDLGAPAEFLNLETDSFVYVTINGNSNAVVYVDANSSLSFSARELLIDQITIANTSSGATTATIQTIVAATV